MAVGLSLRARESIKTGLAMVIAVGIAFRMAFEEPSWAMYAVAMVSLDTAGQSLNKAALRMGGTLVAGIAALTFIGLFPQARWGMIGVLGVYVGVCAYMMTGKKRQYFWFVSAFVCMTVMIHGGVEAANAFRFAVARVEETALGILVYSMVSLFLWPHNSRADLEAASRALFDSQHRLYHAYRGLLVGESRDVDTRALRLEEIQRLTQLEQALNAAETDTYEVRELRHVWHSFVRQSTALMETLGRWRVSLPEVRPLDLARLLPGTGAFLAELDRRFSEIERVLAGETVEGERRTIGLEGDDRALGALSHFEKGAVVLLSTQLRKLDELSRGLWACVAEIRGTGRIKLEPMPEATCRAFLVDVDRLRSAVTVVAAMWISFPIWIWLDPPGHASFWYMTTQWVLISTLTRQSLPTLVPGFAFGIAAAAAAYIGVMPHLSGYGELGLMLFLLVSGGFYLFWEPRRRGMRAIFLVMISTLCSFENQQTYSFAGLVNGVDMVLLSLALSFAITYLGSSPRPEKVFLRLLARFFRHAEFLMSRLAAEPAPDSGRWERWRAAIYRTDLLELPQKLNGLAEQIDYRLLPGTDSEHVRALVTNLFDVALRIKELGDARERVGSDPRLEQVVDDLRAWRLLAQQQFRAWADDPSAALGSGADAAGRLSARLARMEANIETARAGAGAEPLRVDYESFYRYLGGFRGLSEAAISYAGLASAVDWKPWQEARF